MKGWVRLAVFVAIYDTWAAVTSNKTLSCEFRDTSRENPALVALLTAYMLAHLGGFVPSKMDPLHGYVALIKIFVR